MGSVRPAGLAALVVAIASCGGRTLSLGDKNPRRYHFDPPQIVAELASNARTDNPTLTADLLEIYFTTDRVSGNGDVWVARRNNPELPFDPPTAVTEVNSAAFETSAAISADGLTLWFGSDRVGSVGTDIWMSNRPNRSAAWPTPVNVVALNTAAEDIPRPPGQHGLVMPLSSKAGTTTDYRTFLATRPSTGALFRMPVLVSELVYPDRSTVDGFLTDDGLTMFFSSSPFQFPPDAGPRPGDAGSTVDGGRVAFGGSLRRLAAGGRRPVLRDAAPRRPEHRRRRARPLADPRRQDAVLHVRPRRRADHLHGRGQTPLSVGYSGSARCRTAGVIRTGGLLGHDDRHLHLGSGVRLRGSSRVHLRGSARVDACRAGPFRGARLDRGLLRCLLQPVVAPGMSDGPSDAAAAGGPTGADRRCAGVGQDLPASARLSHTDHRRGQEHRAQARPMEMSPSGIADFA